MSADECRSIIDDFGEIAVSLVGINLEGTIELLVCYGSQKKEEGSGGDRNPERTHRIV